ncbi:MAG: site-2 protease family protein [Leptospirales bacterium]
MIIFILGGALMLGVCIIVHELGHLVGGKLVGVKAEIFSIGYGRGIWKKKIGDTTWQVTAIPLGGYVKFYGAEDFEQTEKAPGGLFSVGPLKRMIPILGGPFANLLLGLAIFLLLHVFSGPLAPRIYLHETLGEKSPAYAGGLRNGDSVLAINDEAVGDFHDMVKLIVLSEGRPLEFRIRRGEETKNIKVTPVVNSSGTSEIGIRMPGEMYLMVSYPFYQVLTYNFTSIFGDTAPPRELRAYPYLRDGDRIIDVQGEAIHSVRDLQRVLGANHGETVTVTVDRESLPWLAPWPTHRARVEIPSAAEHLVHIRKVFDQKYERSVGDQIFVSVSPEHQKRLSEIRIDGEAPGSFERMAERFPAARGGTPVALSMSGREYRAAIETEKIGTLGFISAASIRGDYLDNHDTVLGVLGAAYNDTFKNVMIYPAFFSGLFSGRISFIDNAAGPVRIFGAAGTLIKSDYQNYLQLFAAISIALFIMNLIPFPIVDGGHIVFYLYEAIAGKPVSPAVLESIYKVAFSMLMFLGLWIMYRDIIWIIGL